MSRMYDPEGYAQFQPWGPFIDPKTFVPPITTCYDIAIASTVFGIAIIIAILAAYLAVQQTKASRNPLKCAYIWMIWIEWATCIIIAFECILFLLYVIKPNFYFYMSILFLWSIQIHCLLQIIINRIRVILIDRRRGRIIIICVAVFVLLINISVFIVWMPARLQTSERHIQINEIWDRTEKCIYLLVDGCLNWYFIHVIKANLVANGLQKYNRIVRFNQRIIIFSLSMDVMIITSMSIPNSFTYSIFHPLAFLVKLNIEMTMANLIRKIALDSSNFENSFLNTFSSIKSEYSTPKLKPGVSPETPFSEPDRAKWMSSFLPNKWGWSWGWTKPVPHPQEEGILKTEEFSVVSRRRSQLSLSLFRWSSQKVKRGRDDSGATSDNASVGRGDVEKAGKKGSKCGCGK